MDNYVVFAALFNKWSICSVEEGFIVTGGKFNMTFLNAIFYLIVLHLASFVIMFFLLKDGASDKQEQGASSSKPKPKVKSVDLPILASTTRQLDKDVLNNFVEYEVSSSFSL